MGSSDASLVIVACGVCCCTGGIHTTPQHRRNPMTEYRRQMGSPSDIQLLGRNCDLFLVAIYCFCLIRPRQDVTLNMLNTQHPPIIILTLLMQHEPSDVLKELLRRRGSRKHRRNPMTETCRQMGSPSTFSMVFVFLFSLFLFEVVAICCCCCCCCCCCWHFRSEHCTQGTARIRTVLDWQWPV